MHDSASSDDLSLSPSEWDVVVRRDFNPLSSFAVAVSGGVDSLTLVFLMADFAKRHQLLMMAFTVDHRLRSESTDEALYVHDLLKTKGIHHQILTWEFDVQPTTRLQESARFARYQLLQQACDQHQCEALFVGHHLDDQIETFMMRLNHRSGLKGLSSMQRVSPLLKSSITLIRPFLSISKQRIIATAKDLGLVWKDDPSNVSNRFERVRMRQWIHQGDVDGLLNKESIGQSISKLQEANQFIDDCVNHFLQRQAMPLCSFSHQDFKQQAVFLQGRIVQAYLMHLGHNTYIPPDRAICDAREKIAHDHFKALTLGGLLFKRKKDVILIEKENRLVV